ncbi:MAG: DUF6607 family protein [Pseudomonadota bacterium]
MKIHVSALLMAAAMMTVPLGAPALADGPVAGKTAEAEKASFDADRASILAMAGNYKVTFDMKETTPWRADYTPIAAKISGGHEVVRAIVDTGRTIVLQHLLVVTDDKGKTFVIKHWRQDWVYEPETVLTYAGQGKWKLDDVPASMRKGRWSQTVWQTDDSPRYGGWGQWTDEGGVRRWRSSWTTRPLARRDAVRHPPYDRYLGINRHSPSPAGWIHWQDNLKQGLVDGKLVPFVQETVLNTYVKDDRFDVAAADTYWTATRDYWAAVRGQWDAAIAKAKGVSVAEVAETGSASGSRLMGFADDIQAKKLTTKAAIAKAQAVITEVTTAG